MPITKISVNEFKKQLRVEIEEIAKSQDWSLDKAVERGYAFQLWVASLFCSYDKGFDGEPEDALLYSNDLCADIVLEDSNRRHLLIVQCKYESLTKTPPINENLVNDFFHRHEHFLDRKWVKEHGSDAAFELLGDYGEKIRGGFSVDYYYVSTGEASPRTWELATRCTELYSQQDLPIKCYLLDFGELKDFYIRSESLEESVPGEVRLQLLAERFFEKTGPYPTIVAVLKGNALRDLYRQYKESLFAWNICGYLGKRGINDDIIQSAKAHSRDFFTLTTVYLPSALTMILNRMVCLSPKISRL